MSNVSAMQRTLATLREQGWTCEKTERWNPFAKIRQDLFGFIDVLAFRGKAWGDPVIISTPGSNEWLEVRTDADGRWCRIMAIQVTLGQGDVAKHLTKLAATPAAVDWVRAGFPLEIWSWAKRNDNVRGARKVWKVKVTPVTLELLENAYATR